ncbi:hypothetical protein RAS1_41050 [Phycisphaerae bacterium RAS1]|nr:hypothetical protein RAS1_41050 [Phycisphaerae bacterium RAS1]
MFGRVAVARLDPSGGPTAAANLAALEAALQDAQRLVSTLASLARLRPPKIGPFGIPQLLQDANRLLRHALTPNVALRVDIAAESPVMALGDALHVEHALLYLAADAGESMTDGGDFHISVADAPPADAADLAPPGGPAPPAWTILIHATPSRPAHQPDDPATIDAHPVDLPVQQLLSAIGGRVHIEHRAAGETLARLVLPSAGAQAGAHAPFRSPGEPSPLIIVGQAREDVRRILVSMLSSLGFTAVATNTLSAAADVLSSRQADARLVILDEDLFESPSPDLSNPIERRFGRTPVLLLTTGSPRRDHSTSSVALLQKPFRLTELASAVSRAIATRA